MVRPWFAIAVVAACGHSADPAPAPSAAAPAPPSSAPPPSCDAIHLELAETGDAHERARLLVAGEGLEPWPSQVHELVTRAAAEACKADRWPAAQVRCLASDDLAVRATCVDALSDEQRVHLRARVDAAIATRPAVEVAREARAPWRDLPTGTGVPACDAYLAAVNGLAHCAAVPATVLDQLGEVAGLVERNAVELRLAGSDLPPGASTQAGADCTDARTQVGHVATAFACPTP